MNSLPTELENIILDYQYQLETMEKMKIVLSQLKQQVEYEIEEDFSSSTIIINGREISYYSSYDFEDYIFSVEENEVFKHIELEIFGRGWVKFDNNGKQVFYSRVY